MNTTALEKAIDLLGGMQAAARAIGVSPQRIFNWKQRGRVPADACPAIEKATNGAVRCEDLRPDVDWGYLRGTQRKAA